MSTPTSRIASMASGRTRVFSVPALEASKRSPAMCRSSPSAICERAELWVQRKSTRDRSRVSATAQLHVQPEVVGGIGDQAPGGGPVQRVEAPPAPPLFSDEPGLPELLHVVGDLGLAHPEVRLELADADAGVLILGRHAAVGQAAAPAAPRHHPEHPYPYGVGEGAPERDEAPDPRLVVHDPQGTPVLRNDARYLLRHRLYPASGLRARTKALAAGTLRSASRFSSVSSPSIDRKSVV